MTQDERNVLNTLLLTWLQLKPQFNRRINLIRYTYFNLAQFQEFAGLSLKRRYSLEEIYEVVLHLDSFKCFYPNELRSKKPEEKVLVFARPSL